MAQLLSGTRIYGTATVDTQLFVNGTAQSLSTDTGALQVVGGVGVGGSLYVGATSTLTGVTKITDSTEAATTTSGALVVSGGVAVAKDLRVFGTIYGLVNGTVIGVITTATNLASGSTGQIPFQINSGVTSFFGPGTAGQLLVSAGASATGPVFTNTSSIYVGRSALNDDLVGGAAGDLPYQLGPNNTTFLNIGSAGRILSSTGSAPQWSTTGSLIVGRAAESDTALLVNDNSNNSTHYITFASTTTGYTSLKGSALTGLTFKPNGGYLGLGTNAPSYKLHIVESADVVPASIERPLGGDILELYNSSGLTTNYSQIAFLHKDSTNAAVAASRIAGYSTSLGSGAVSGGLIFYIRNAGTQNEAARIDNAGNLGIGVSPDYRLDVSGGARITGITTITNATASSSPITGALQVTGGAGISGNINTAGQISSTRANNTATGAGQLYLNGITGNRIDFGTAGVGAPTLVTRSVGTKIVLYPNISLSTTDYGFGVESGAMWSSVASAADSFIWYAANTNIASLNGSGNLTLSGDLAINGGDVTSSQSSFNLLASGVTTLNLGTAGTAITIGSNTGGTTTIRNVLALTSTTNSTAVGNGTLVVSGGASIASDLRVGGTIFGSVSVTGIISTATNLAGGTAGQVPYQTGTGFTSFFGPGIAGQILTSGGTNGPVYVNTGNIYVGFADVSDRFKVTDEASSSAIHYITFTTANSGNATLRVDSADLTFQPSTGNLGIGAATPSAKLDVNGATFLRGVTTVTDTTLATSVNSGALQVRGGAGFAADIYATGAVLDSVRVGVTSANEIDTISGNLVLDSASGTTQVDDNLVVTGNLTVQGTTTIVDSTVTNVSDPIFTIGTGPNGGAPSADDNKDRGIAFHWHNGATPRVGFFGYDDSTGYFTFLTSATFTNEVVAPAGGTTRGAVDVNLAGGAAGSLPYQSAANVSTFLPIGTDGFILTAAGGLPTWASSSGITVGTASALVMTNDVATSTPQFITFVGTATGSATVKASAMSGLTWIPSSSYLGIGINTPTYPLHINVPSGLASIGLSGTAANAQTMKIMQGVTGVTNSGFSIYDASNSATRLMIGSTGNVGIGTGTQDPSDRLHISNSGGTAQLRVGDSASIQVGLLLQRRNSSIDAQSHYFVASANNPWYLYGENLVWSGERAGNVTATVAARPYYEAYAPSVGYKEFGFANVTTGAIATGNLIPNLVLKNDGFVGINTTNPTDYLTIDAKGSSTTNYGLTIKDSTVNAVNETTGIKFAWNTANAADIKAVVTNISNGASALTFGTSNDGSTISERMRIAQGGNVGIGELDPASYGKLTVRISSNSGVGAGGSAAIWLQNANGAANNAASIFFGDTAAAAMGAINLVHVDYANNYGDITFDTRGAGGYAERVRIDGTGNVGIAKTAANARLNVLGNVGIDLIDSTTSSALMNSNATNNMLYFRAPFNSNPAAVANAGAKWGIVFSGGPSGDNTTYPIVASTSTIGKAASIYAVSEDTGAGYNRKVGMGFWTSDQDLNQVEIVRISGAGNVGIGTTTPAYKLDVNGTTRLGGTALITGVTSITNTTQATSTTTGALQVTGGVGIGGNLHVGGTINGTIVGTISGVATTASTITITNETASASTHYLTFVDGTGNKPVKIDTSELAFVPSTGRIGIGNAAPAYKLDLTGEFRQSGENIWFDGANVNFRADNVFNFLTDAGGAQTGKFKSIQVSTSYSGTIPDDGILFGTDSTLYRSAATRIRTNSTLVVDGNLGVGDTAPDVKLSILQNSDVWHARFGATATTKQVRIGGNTTNGAVIGAYNTGDNSSPTQLLLNRDGGNVGIGTSNATYKLDIAGNSNGDSFRVYSSNTSGPALAIHNTGTGGKNWHIISNGSSNAAGAGHLQFWNSTDSVTAAVLTSTGNLGLGTTTNVPLTRLHIALNNSSTQSAQVNGFTLRTNENNGMEWHLNHTNGYQGWVAAARVNNNGSSWGQAYLEFITAGSGGGNQVSTMALHGNGNVSIGSTAAPTYKLFVNGSFAATTKSFVIDHPIKSGWKLRYASLEGPENGVYVRGRLKDNNVIVLPDYWRELVDVDTITVEITPVGKYQKLYVESINSQYIVIATESDMSVNCFYTVYGERKDVNKLVVEYED